MPKRSIVDREASQVNDTHERRLQAEDLALLQVCRQTNRDNRLLPFTCTTFYFSSLYDLLSMHPRFQDFQRLQIGGSVADVEGFMELVCTKLSFVRFHDLYLGVCFLKLDLHDGLSGAAAADPFLQGLWFMDANRGAIHAPAGA